VQGSGRADVWGKNTVDAAWEKGRRKNPVELVNPMFAPAENKSPAYQRETIEPEYWTTSKARWVFIILLTVALGALVCFGYLALKKRNIQISQLFGDQTRINSLGQRVDAAEGKLRDLTSGWEGIAQRVTALEGFQGKVSRDLQQTRKYAQGLTERLHQQVGAELEARTSVLDARLRQVESEQTAQRSQLAQVEDSFHQEIASAREEAGRDLSSAHREAEDNARNLATLSQRLDRERVDFEVAKGRATELVPGISLQINGTNNVYQHFRGSLWLLQDHRTMWLRDESVHQPVRFYHREGGEPYELVVTDVTKHSVIGYLLVPKGQEAAVSVLSDNGDAATSPSGND
jgi:hypothetical protein